MKTKTTLISALFLWACLTVSAQQIAWQKAIGGNDSDYGTSIAPTPDGGFIISGSPRSGNGDITQAMLGYEDAWLARVNNNGEIQWQKRYGGSQPDEVKCVIPTSDGGYLFCGSTKSTDGDLAGLSPQNYDIWIVKTDPVGTIQWQKIFGGTLSDYSYKVIQTLDGGFLCTGYKASASGKNGWAIKLAASGTLEWDKLYDKASQDYLYDVKQLSDGSYIFCGSSNPSLANGGHDTNSHNDGWVIKTDGTGTQQWMKCFGSPQHDQFVSVETTADGGYMLAGVTESMGGNVYYNHNNNDLAQDVWVVMLDNAGELVWEKSYGGTEAERCNSMRKTANGYLLVGSTYSNDGDVPQGTYNGYRNDAWAFEIDTNGGLLWQKTYGGTQGGINGPFSEEYFSDCLRLADGSSVFFGRTASSDVDVVGAHGSDDMWLVKVTANNYDYISLNGTAAAYPIDYPMATLDGINYRIHRILLSGGNSAAMRFRKNHEWNVNWGGPSALPSNNFPSATGVQDGQNIEIPETAFYDVTLNIQTGDYTFTNVGTTPAVSIFGSNTGGVDIPMQGSSNYMIFTAYHNFTNFGSVKFRKNGNNDMNWSMGTFPSGYGVQNGALIPVPPGYYYITFNMLTGYYTFTSLLSTEDFTEKNALTVFPNPTFGKIQIKSESAIKQIDVYDVTGRAAVHLQNTDTVDLSELESGVYLLKASTDKGNFTKQILKQ